MVAQHSREGIPEEYRPAEWLLHAPHRPPNDTAAELDPQHILAAVGYVTTLWEALETLLSQFYVASCGGGDPKALSATYGSISSFGAKIDVLERVTKLSVPVGQEKGHRDLMNDLRRCSACRNSIAHSVLALVSPGKIEVCIPLVVAAPPAGHGYQLVTSPYNTLKTRGWMWPSTYYISPTIHKIAAEIVKITARVTSVVSGTGSFKKYTRFQIT